MKKILIALVAASAALTMTACGSSEETADDDYSVSQSDDEFVEEYLSDEPTSEVTMDDGSTMTSEDYTLAVLEVAWEETSAAEQVEICDEYAADSESVVQDVLDVDPDMDEYTVDFFFALYCD